jgi:hypothetical protein
MPIPQLPSQSLSHRQVQPTQTNEESRYIALTLGTTKGRYAVAQALDVTTTNPLALGATVDGVALVETMPVLCLAAGSHARGLWGYGTGLLLAAPMPGDLVYVEAGTVYGDTLWVCTRVEIGTDVGDYGVTSWGDYGLVTGAFWRPVMPLRLTSAVSGTTLPAHDGVVWTTKGPGLHIINLPDVADAPGVRYTVKDRSGLATALDPIRITPGGGALIDGAAYLDVSGAYGAQTIQQDGSHWYTV